MLFKFITHVEITRFYIAVIRKLCQIVPGRIQLVDNCNWNLLITPINYFTDVIIFNYNLYIKHED